MRCTLACILLVLSLEFGSSIAQDKKVTDSSNNVNKITLTSINISVTTSSKNEPSTLNQNNITNENVTKKPDSTMFKTLKDNKEMLIRTFYVMLGVTSIVVIYFVVRAWRARRRQNKSRKYGLLATSGADLEMEPLDRDVDDDDEMTMFERRR